MSESHARHRCVSGLTMTVVGVRFDAGLIHPPPAPLGDGERIKFSPHPRYWRTGRQGRPRFPPFVDRGVLMRDFRDAKAMAHSLRDALKANAIETTHSESLELIAKAFGYDNWNILAAKIEAAEPRDAATPTSSPIAAPESAANRQLPTLALPPGMTTNIQPPSPDVPSQYAVFVGKWGGYWGGELASNVYVVSVGPAGDARGVYAWGVSSFVVAPGAVNF